MLNSLHKEGDISSVIQGEDDCRSCDRRWTVFEVGVSIKNRQITKELGKVFHLRSDEVRKQRRFQEAGSTKNHNILKQYNSRFDICGTHRLNIPR